MEQSGGAIDRALDLLFHLHGAGQPRGVTEIARALDWPKSTTHRLLSSLRGRGIVERDDGGRYRPGIALLALGLGVLEREPVAAAARPVLEATSAELGETLFLAAARGGRLIVLDKCEGPGFLRAAPRVGAELPAHATAIGKLYLALDPGQLAGLTERTAYTPATRVDAAVLEPELARVRERGWAANDEEWIAGLTGIAAPVTRGGRISAAIAVSGASARFAGAAHERCSAAIVAAAARIERRLEGAGT